MPQLTCRYERARFSTDWDSSCGSTSRAGPRVPISPILRLAIAMELSLAIELVGNEPEDKSGPAL